MEATEFGPSAAGVPGSRGGGEAGAVWLRDDPARVRRVPLLSRDRIIDAAVSLLDEQGIDRLTMRRLAQQLEVTPTALYWHVKTKDDVLDLALDEIFGEIQLPAAGDDWRAEVRALMHRWRSVMLQHPWAPSLIGRPMLGPNVLARTEFLQSALVRGGYTDVHLAVATRVLANYVIGAALTEATWRQSNDPGARAEARKLIAKDRAAYPTLHSSGHLDDARWSDDELFERGLDAILTPSG